jgi:hypothetical protein
MKKLALIRRGKSMKTIKEIGKKNIIKHSSMIIKSFAFYFRMMLGFEKNMIHMFWKSLKRKEKKM